MAFLSGPKKRKKEKEKRKAYSLVINGRRVFLQKKKKSRKSFCI